MRFRMLIGILLVITCVFLTGCGNKTAVKLFEMFGDSDAYVIEKRGLAHTGWDEVIIVFGYHDDYSVSENIAKYLSRSDGGEYRVVKLKK